jgi:dTDP-4-amino-4,6-dideoxygalactose transaminase
MNSRLDELQAAILRAKLSHLAAATQDRRRLAARYLAGLADLAPLGLGLPEAADPAEHVYHLFVVHYRHRDALQAFLAERGIQALVHYPLPLHRQPAFAPLARGPLAAAEALADWVLSLPLYPGLSETEVDDVIEAMHAFFASTR